MKLNFIFSNLNIIVLSIYLLFLIIVSMRFFRPVWVKNISYKKLLIIAFSLKIFYGLFISWGQYHVWANAIDFTKMFVNSPLPKEVPMPYILEWTRAFFDNNFGFYLYYILGRFWLNIAILFIVSLTLYFIFKIWKSYRGGFPEYGPEIILILMLIVGWPGLMVFIPLGFIVATITSLIFHLKGKNTMDIIPMFIFTAFIVLLFGDKILLLLKL